MLSNKQVAKLLRTDGWLVFDIKKDNANGPDLTIAKHGKSFRVEVKNAIYNKRSWQTKPVGKSGKICDLIIIVLPCHRLIMQPMKDHLALCSGSGVRFITNLVFSNTRKYFGEKTGDVF